MVQMVVGSPHQKHNPPLSKRKNIMVLMTLIAVPIIIFLRWVFNNGLILQFGYQTTNIGNANIIFPIAFSNTLYVAIAYGCYGVDVIVSTFPTRTVTAGKGNLYQEGTYSTGWFCIGY